MSVKGKEAARKAACSKTGGGPPSEISFKLWELDVRS
jgi:hypothetical protein